MRIAIAALAVLCLLPVAASAGVSTAVYILDDPLDVFPPGEPNTLYVWLMFFDNEVTELDFGLTGTLSVVSVTPAPGWTNVGTTDSPHLVKDVGGEWIAPIAAVVVDDLAGGGNLCYTESSLTGRLCFRWADDGGWYHMQYFGFATAGSEGCSGYSDSAICEDPVSVDGASWGRLKARYREPGR